MDKKEERAKIVKLSPKDKSILLNIDKSSKWEDVKAIDSINDEIANLEIYRDFIGLGCSKYLNDSGEKGEIDIEEMFRNCREAEKVRQRVKKREIREERKGMKTGKAGLVKGNIGEKKQIIKEIPSKQVKSNPIVDKAKEVGNAVKEILTRSSKEDDWKASIVKLGLGVGLDTLFGIIIGVMDYSFNNPRQGVAIVSGALTLIGSLYAYISQTETGIAIRENLKKWITGKLNELYNYLTGQGINVIKKKGKKKPFDRGGSSRNDDDDDDNDDGGGDSFTFDGEELDAYGSPQQQEQRQERTEQQQERPQLTQAEGMLYNLIRSQERNRTINDMNNSTTRMFQENPLPTATQQYTQPDVRQEPNIQPTTSLSEGLNIGANSLTVGSAIFAGATALSAGLSNLFADGGATQMRDIGGDIPDMDVQDGGEFFDAQPPPQSGNLFSAFNAPRLDDNDLPTNIAPRGRIEPRYDLQRNPLSDQETIDNQREELQRRGDTINDLNNRLTDEEIRRNDLTARINDEINNMDLHGRSWGLFFGGNNGGSKTAEEGLNNLVLNYGSALGLANQELTDAEIARERIGQTGLQALEGQRTIMTEYESQLREFQAYNRELQEQSQEERLSRMGAEALSNVRQRTARAREASLMEDIARQRQVNTMTQDRMNKENQMIREKLEQSLMTGEDRKPTPAEREIIEEQKRLLEQQNASIKKLQEEKKKAQEDMVFFEVERETAEKEKKSPPRQPADLMAIAGIRPERQISDISLDTIYTVSDSEPAMSRQSSMYSMDEPAMSRTSSPEKETDLEELYNKAKAKKQARGRNVLAYLGREVRSITQQTTYSDMEYYLRQNTTGLPPEQIQILLDTIQQLRLNSRRLGRATNMFAEDFVRLWGVISGFFDKDKKPPAK